MDYIEEIDYKGYRIKIAQDDDPIQPPDDCDDSVVFLVSFEPYLQKNPDHSPVSCLADLKDLISGPPEEGYEDYEEEDGKAEFAEAVAEWKEERDEWLIFEVSVQTQGYTSMHFCHGEPDADDVRAAIFVKKDGGWGEGVDLKKIARDYCKAWDQYLSGDVYGYMIDGPLEQKQDLCEKCGHVQREYEEREVLDSCWGFYGLDYCIEEAKGMVDYQLNKEKARTL